MDTFTLQIEPDGPTVLEYPVPLGTNMLLQVQMGPNLWRAFKGKARADFQGWRLHPAETRGILSGAACQIVTFTSGEIGNSVTVVAEGTAERVI